MNFTQAISSGFRKYVEFSGRATRSEYWYWTLFTSLGYLIALIVDAFTTGFLVYLLFALATFLPSMAVTIRRLHDVDRSGWWIHLSLVPIIGAIVLLIWYVSEGTPGENRFGEGSIARGARLCPQCGAENQLESVYCSNCGGNRGLESEVEAPVVTGARFLTPLVGLIAGLVFALILLQVTRLSPETIASSLGENGNQEVVEHFRKALSETPSVVLFWPASKGLDSLMTGRSVAEQVGDRLPITLELMIMGGFLAVLLAWALGLALGSVRPHPGVTAARISVAVLAAIPGFWLATMIIVVGARYLEWSPRLQYYSLWDDPKYNLIHFFWPVVVVGIIGGLGIALEMRSRDNSSPLRVLARPLGLVLRHGGMLLSGIILIELVFSLPGLGNLLVRSASQQDAPVLGASAAVFIWLALWSRFLGNLLLATVDRNTPARTGARRGTESGLPLAIGGGVTLALLALLFLAPFAAAQDPQLFDMRNRLSPPGAESLFGTDAFGRDVLSRVLYGGRVAAQLGLPMALPALLVGVPMLVARIALDRARAPALAYGIEGVLEGLVAVPWLVIGILVQVYIGSSWPFVALAAILVPRAMRVGWEMGAGERLQAIQVAYSVLRLGVLFLAAALAISTALGFLGLGVPPPQADLGWSVGGTGRDYFVIAPWLAIFPGLVLSLIAATWLGVATLLSRSGPEYRAVGWVHTMS